MSTKLTPEQKLEAKQREQMLRTINRVKSDWSFGKIKTFGQLLFSLGLDEQQALARNYYKWELEQPVDKSFVWDYLQDIKISHDVEVFLKHNPPAIDPEFYAGPPVELKIDTSPFIEPEEKEYEKYKLLPSPNENKNLFLFWFQKKAVAEILKNILVDDKRGQLLLAGVGTGKTFILGATIRRLIDANFHKDSLSPFPYIYVTKASIVEQTQRALKVWFNLTEQDITVINIEQLRAKFGSMFLKEEIKFEGGQEHVVWKWRNNVNPIIIIWDESQVLKNTDSDQSKIAQSFNEILADTHQIFSSATPFTRVCEAKCFAVSTRIPYTFGIAKDAPLTNAHWSTFAEDVAQPAEPHEHSPAAIERLIDKLEPYVVRVKGVKSQFKAINSVEMIDFECEADKQYYLDAWEHYLAEKAKIESGDYDPEQGSAKWQQLTKFLKFRQAAELCRAKTLAKLMYEAVNYNNLAAISALNFKNTITKVVRILIEEYGVPRDQISLIWGGATKTAKQKEAEKKAKAKKKLELSDDVMAALEAEGITLANLDLDEIEDNTPEFVKDIPDEYKLGAQSLKERQKEIDRFQSGKSLYCLYTFRAGGVGLSLHHTDEYTKEKVRHKESGYAFEEDIKNVPTRQRINFVAPTYSAIELVQGLGRAPRLTSLSDTVQKLIFYKNTIEQRVAYIVSIKLRCLGKVVKQKESWEDVALKTHVDDEVTKHTKPEDNVPDEDTGFVAAGSEEETEE